MANDTIGGRQNNPLNIRENPNNRWEGGIPTDKPFAEFESEDYGLRAADRVLSNYDTMYGANTISDVITRFAPPHENDTDNYINFVSEKVGIAPDVRLGSADRYKVIGAMAQMETGTVYEDGYVQEAILRANGGTLPPTLADQAMPSADPLTPTSIEDTYAIELQHREASENAIPPQVAGKSRVTSKFGMPPETEGGSELDVAPAEEDTKFDLDTVNANLDAAIEAQVDPLSTPEKPLVLSPLGEDIVKEEAERVEKGINMRQLMGPMLLMYEGATNITTAMADAAFASTENEFYATTEEELEGFWGSVQSSLEDSFDGEDNSPEREGEFMNRLDVMLSPLESTSSAVLAPVLEFLQDSSYGLEENPLSLSERVQKAGGTSLQAFVDEMRPTYGEGFSDYGYEIINEIAPSASEGVKIGSGIVLEIVTDPMLVVGAPIFKLVQRGMRSLASQAVDPRTGKALDTVTGVVQAGMADFAEWTATVGSKIDNMEVDPEQLSFLGQLALKADAGDTKALKQLDAELKKLPAYARFMKDDELSIIEKAARDLDESLGSPKDPAMSLGAPKSSKGGATRTDKVHPDEIDAEIILNSARINSESDIDELIAALAKIAQRELDKVKGKVTNEATLAEAKNIELKNLLGKATTTFSAAEAVALRQGLEAAASQVSRYAKLYETTGNLIYKVGYEKNMAIFGILDAKATGVATNAGRLLQAHNISDTGNQVTRLRQLNNIMGVYKNGPSDAAYSAEAVMMKAIANSEDTKFVAQLLGKRDLLRKLPGITMEVFINSMISGLGTQAVNFKSNAALLFMAPTERVASALVAGVTGNPKLAQNELREARVMLTGYAQAMGDIARLAFTRTSWEDLNLPDGIKYTHEIASQRIKHHVSAANLQLDGKAGWLADIAGHAIRFAGDALMAADKSFKIANYRAHINAMAIDRATAVARDSNDIRSIYNTLRHNPDEDMIVEAANIASRNTFTNSLSKLEQKAHSVIVNTPMAMAIPFYKTSTNIVKSGIEHGAVGTGVKGFRDYYRVLQGELDNGGQIASRATARIALGTGLPVGIMNYLGDDITGHIDYNTPSGRLKLEMEVPEYSIYRGVDENGKAIYWHYGEFEPLRMVLGLMVNYRNAYNSMHAVDPITGEENPFLKELAAVTMAPFIMTVTDNYLLENVGSIVDLLEGLASEDLVEGERQINRIISTIAVPNVINQINSTYFDQNFRKADNLIQEIMKRTPELSKWLAMDINPWGEPRMKPEMYGPDYITSTYSSGKPLDKYEKELMVLGVNIGDPPPYITPPETPKYERVKLELNSKQKEIFAIVRGKGVDGNTPIKASIVELMESDFYKSTAPNIQKALITNLWANATAQATQYLWENDYSLQHDYDVQVEKLQALRAQQSSQPRQIGESL